MVEDACLKLDAGLLLGETGTEAKFDPEQTSVEVRHGFTEVCQVPYKRVPIFELEIVGGIGTLERFDSLFKLPLKVDCHRALV